MDKFQYLPRSGKGNGILMKGKVFYSNDQQTWTDAGTFDWAYTDAVKTFDFTTHPTARYVKLVVSEGSVGFGSGRELYIFKVPGTSSYLPGDINNDHLLDRNDLTSYTNYTGLRKGDADFEGYISNGDINGNNLIDAYDISSVATQIDGGVGPGKIDKASGKLEISSAKAQYAKDEIIEVKVRGIDIKSVNAFSFALPYFPKDYKFVSVQILNTRQMDNLTYDRLHTNGNHFIQLL